MFKQRSESQRYLTQQQVSDVENHTQGKLGSEEGEEPLGGVHVCLQVHRLEVRPEVRELFLLAWETVSFSKR